MGRVYALLATCLALAGIYGMGHHAGTVAAEVRADRQRLASVTRAIEQANRIAAEDAAVLTAHEAAVERIRTVFRSIDREVIRYVATHSADDPVCLDADGMRLWAAANASDFPAGTGQPDGGLPAPAAGAGVLPGGGPAGESRGGDAGVSRLPATASRPGGVGAEPGATAAGILDSLRRVTPPHWGMP